MRWKQLKSGNLAVLLILVFVFAACNGGDAETAVITKVEEPIEPEPTLPTADTLEVEPEAAEPTVPPEPTTVSTPTETAVSVLTPIEVTYFTPSQQEGPYYPVNKPEDKDNDLVEFAGATGIPNGQILEFDGTVYDANGLPLEGLTLEIWQTDANGVYSHPDDPGTNGRDPNFQFYGEALTDAAGSYSFRTIFPGQYEPRPRHIHVKVKLDGQELLTTQFYFAGEVDLQGDDAAMIIATEPVQDDAGNTILKGKRDIILNFTQAD